MAGIFYSIFNCELHLSHVGPKAALHINIYLAVTSTFEILIYAPNIAEGNATDHYYGLTTCLGTKSNTQVEFAGIWALACIGAMMLLDTIHRPVICNVDSRAFDRDWDQGVIYSIVSHKNR